MVYVYYACLKPKRLGRYIAFGKRKLGFHPTVSLPISLETARRRLWHRDFPTSVNVILGNQCNLRCDHCPYHGPTAPRYFASPVRMENAVIERLICELPKHRTNAKFGGFEEPLLYDDFQTIADHLIRNDVGVHLTTNGTLITTQLMPLLRRLSTLYVSIDAATPETYRKIRGGDFFRLLKNVTELSGEFIGDRMGVSFIRNPVSVSEEHDFLEFWLSKVHMVIYYALLEFEQEGYSIKEMFLSPPSERIVCSSPWLETCVLPNGDVSLCCQTLVMTGRQEIPIMGNLTELTLEEIWNGEAYEGYRNALLEEDWSVAKICRACPLWAASYYRIWRHGNLKITCNPTTKVIERIGARHS